MVTKKGLEKYISMSTEIAKETQVEPETVERILKQVEAHIENNRRQPKPPPPKGGITIRKAALKYRIPDRTIGRWAKQGSVPVLLKTSNEVYINEAIFANIATAYNSYSGSKRRTLNNVLKKSSAN